MQEVVDSMQVSELVDTCLIMQAFVQAIKSTAGWLAGCNCHQHLLQAGAGRPTTFRARMAAYRNASATCPWKGRRATELIANNLEPLVVCIRGAWSTNML